MGNSEVQLLAIHLQVCVYVYDLTAESDTVQA